MFCKIYKNKSLLYLFKSIPVKTSSHVTSNVDDIPFIKIKHNFFKNVFFPSAIIEKQNPQIYYTYLRKFFNCYSDKGIRLMTRLCLGRSHQR